MQLSFVNLCHKNCTAIYHILEILPCDITPVQKRIPCYSACISVHMNPSISMIPMEAVVEHFNVTCDCSISKNKEMYDNHFCITSYHSQWGILLKSYERVGKRCDLFCDYNFFSLLFRVQTHVDIVQINDVRPPSLTVHLLHHSKVLFGRLLWNNSSLFAPFISPSASPSSYSWRCCICSAAWAACGPSFIALHRLFYLSDRRPQYCPGLSAFSCRSRYRLCEALTHLRVHL